MANQFDHGERLYYVGTFYWPPSNPTEAGMFEWFTGQAASVNSSQRLS